MYPKHNILWSADVITIKSKGLGRAGSNKLQISFGEIHVLRKRMENAS